MTTFEGIHYLLCALGDGSLFYSNMIPVSSTDILSRIYRKLDYLVSENSSMFLDMVRFVKYYLVLKLILFDFENI